MSRKDNKKGKTRVTVKAGVSDRELREMKEAFAAFDVDGSGKHFFTKYFLQEKLALKNF